MGLRGEGRCRRRGALGIFGTAPPLPLLAVRDAMVASSRSCPRHRRRRCLSVVVLQRGGAAAATPPRLELPRRVGWMGVVSPAVAVVRRTRAGPPRGAPSGVGRLGQHRPSSPVLHPSRMAVPSLLPPAAVSCGCCLRLLMIVDGCTTPSYGRSGWAAAAVEGGGGGGRVRRRRGRGHGRSSR